MIDGMTSDEDGKELIELIDEQWAEDAGDDRWCEDAVCPWLVYWERRHRRRHHSHQCDPSAPTTLGVVFGQPQPNEEKPQ